MNNLKNQQLIKIDEQPVETKNTEEPRTNIIDEQPEEPEQPTHEPTSNIIDKTINANNEKTTKNILKKHHAPKTRTTRTTKRRNTKY